jgi:hypothetical protein
MAMATIVLAIVAYGSNDLARAIFWLMIAGGLSLSAVNIEHTRRSGEIRALLMEIKELLRTERRN